MATNNYEISSSSTINDDEVYSIEIDYNTNYTVKDLGYILEYYKIQKRKIRAFEKELFSKPPVLP